jgi:hypothetical protein
MNKTNRCSYLDIEISFNSPHDPVPLKVLSVEMDLAESGINRKAFIKG